MLKRATLLLLTATALAFGQETQSQNDHKPDAWQKMKDCAAQAEKVGPGEAADNKGNYDNHYSPKYDRCYVRISWTISQGEQVSGLGMRLIDAFEHSTIALSTTTSPESNANCFVESTNRQRIKVVDCSAAAAFIYDHMSN